MQIVRLEAENIKRLSAVRIDVLADSGAVVIAGENESGKSSTLDAIEMALAGERVQPPEPIRRGQEKAYVVVDLGDVVVTRRFTAKGSSLTVANKDGLRYPAGQTVLDGFYSKLTFDPLSFATAKPDEQAGSSVSWPGSIRVTWTTRAGRPSRRGPSSTATSPRPRSR
jgi:hypothetical protein